MDEEDGVLVSISMKFPVIDRQVLADHLAPVFNAAIAVGGDMTNVTIQRWEAED